MIFLSCDRISQKGKGIVDNAKATASRKADDLEDKIFAKFDSGTPDTRFNKMRFTEFFKFEPAPDVENLYCYADLMGIDSKFQFSFTCDTPTLNRIIEVEKLSKVQNEDSYTFESILNPTEFSWWSNNQIEDCVPFFRKDENRVYTYLWYDTLTRKAHYLTYDL